MYSFQRPEPDENTLVDVWDEKARPRPTWRATPAKRVPCAECGTSYHADWWWDQTSDGIPFLVCSCGEQFYLTSERED